MKRRSVTAAAVATLASLVLPGVASAQDYPTRTLKIVQGFAPGGNADTLARILALEMAKGLGKPVIVETKPGAGGTIASDAVAKAPPDGHTLLLMTGGHAVAGALYKKLSYQTLEGFQPISTVSVFPFVVAVRADTDPSLQALIQRDKAKPGSVSFSSAGIGATQHLTGELLSNTAGARFLHVPYKGDAAATLALLGGEVDFVVAPPTAVLPHIRSGKLKALAVTGATRWKALPDVPTVAESGLPGFDVGSWLGIATTAGVPAPVVERLSKEMQRVIQVAEVRAAIEGIGSEVRSSTPEELRARLAEELRRWNHVITEAKIERQ